MKDKIFELIRERRTIRQFTSKEIDNNLLNEVFGTIQDAASWVNGQQTSVVLVKDKELKDKLMELCGGQPQIGQAPVFAVFLNDFAKINHAVEEMTGSKLQLGEDALVTGSVDTALAMTNVMLAAKASGLETCCIGAIRANMDKVSELLNLPEYVVPVSGLVIGYSDSKVDPRPKLQKDVVIFNEKYSKDNFDKALNQLKEDTKDSARTWHETIKGYYGGEFYGKNWNTNDFYKKKGFIE